MALSNYETAGIRISPQKKALLSNRLRRRLKKTGIINYEAYYNHLHKLSSEDPEWDAFLQEVTTHETYLFRDEQHWEWFQNTFLPEVMAQARNGQRERSLRIWSAACSTGDEAYTIACCIANSLLNYSQWKLHILGTDIGIGAIEQSRLAEFGERNIRLVPEAMKKRYFTNAKESRLWRAKPLLTQMTQFKQHNLMQPLRGQAFDLVILKNVLIYFDKQSKQAVIKHLTAALLPEGLLLCGAAEGISDLLEEYQRIEPWLYRKL